MSWLTLANCGDVSKKFLWEQKTDVLQHIEDGMCLNIENPC